MSSDNQLIQTALQGRLSRFNDQTLNSTPYLIMTIFGDSIIPHGGKVWLGSLIRLLAPLGINERRIRTSIFRLSKDGWITGTKVGRRSFYRMRPNTFDEVAENEHNIYHSDVKWDGNWRLVIGASMEKGSDHRDDFRKQLQKHGFISISPNAFAHPTMAYPTIRNLLTRYEVDESYLVTTARDEQGNPLSFEKVESVLQPNMLDGIRKEYRDYIDLYDALFQRRDEINTLDPKDCFLLNTLLINDYRRLLHHDVYNTTHMFDSHWIGWIARKMTASIYRAAESRSRQHFRWACENEGGSLSLFTSPYTARFKHLRNR